MVVVVPVGGGDRRGGGCFPVECVGGPRES